MWGGRAEEISLKWCHVKGTCGFSGEPHEPLHQYDYGHGQRYPLSTVLFPSILPIFTDFYRFFGLSCECITKCVIHRLVYQVYYSLVSILPPPFPSPPLTSVFFGGDFSDFYRFLPFATVKAQVYPKPFVRDRLSQLSPKLS